MQIPSFLRNALVLVAALALGWWMRGANAPVLAQRGSATSSSENLAFQMIGTGPDSSLVLYNRQTHELYVYARAGAGASMVPCTYSLLVTEPGLPLKRTNCQAGELH